MKVTLIAQTEPISSVEKSTLHDMKVFGGLNAGVCYLPDTLDKLFAQPEDKHINRANITLENAHHSVFSHTWIEISIEGIPKIIAMLLNSLGFYNTSEKSGRYTIMKDASPEETEIYEKWINKLVDVIAEVYPNIEEKQRKKLAMENARLMLSVFTPTTLTYTTNLCQLNYIIDWCEKFEAPDNNDFYLKIREYLVELGSKLKEMFYVEGLRDPKNRQFMLLDRDELEFDEIKPYFGKSYQTKYLATFTHLAQGIRHKTLDYVAYFDGKSKEFYTPDILDDYPELSVEWLADMQSLAHLYPQGTLVKVLECGTLTNFLLKCTERECGSAQLDIMQQTLNTHYQYENSPNLTRSDKQLFDKFSGRVKCKMGFRCKSPCVWKSEKATTRKI